MGTFRLTAPKDGWLRCDLRRSRRKLFHLGGPQHILDPRPRDSSRSRKYHSVRSLKSVWHRLPQSAACKGSTRRVQGNSDAGECHTEEDTAGQCQVAVLRLPLLLLHPWLLNVASHLSQQKDTAPAGETARLGELTPLQQTWPQVEIGKATLWLFAHDGICAVSWVHPPTEHVQTRLRNFCKTFSYASWLCASYSRLVRIWEILLQKSS